MTNKSFDTITGTIFSLEDTKIVISFKSANEAEKSFNDMIKQMDKLKIIKR